MCGRFTLSRWEAGELAAELGLTEAAVPVLQPRYNIAPASEHVILRMKHEERELLPARWGLVNSWARAGRRSSGQINARAERVDRTPAFRGAFRKRRCVVPADGFYEWSGPKGKRVPYWFHPTRRSLLLFAGLYEYWQPEPGTWERTFAILTTEANELVRPFHNRMPVILSSELADLWIDPAETSVQSLKALLVPPPADLLTFRRVSTAVNDVKNDFPELLDPVGLPGM